MRARRQRRLIGLVAVLTGATLTLAATSVSAAPFPQPPGWPQQIGGPLADGGNAIAAFPNGDVLLAGSSYSTLSTNANLGAQDVFVVRLDKNGNRLWLTQFGTAGNEVTSSIVISGNAVYVAGTTSGDFASPLTAAGDRDVFVAKLDGKGALKWVKNFGSTGEEAQAPGIAVVSGGPVVVGGTDNSVPGGGGSLGQLDAFLVRFDANGNVKVVEQFGTAGRDWAADVAVKGSAVYVVGGSNGNLTPAGNLGSYDAYLARFDAKGNQQWIHHYGTSESDYAVGVTVDGTAVYMVADTVGAISGATNPEHNDDGLLAKFSAAGALVWERQFGSTLKVTVTDVAAKGGKVHVVGYAESPVDFMPQLGTLDAFVRSLDANGLLLRTREFGTGFSDSAWGVAVRSNTAPGGPLVIAGTTNGTTWGQLNRGTYDAVVSTFPI